MCVGRGGRSSLPDGSYGFLFSLSMHEFKKYAFDLSRINNSFLSTWCEV